MGDYPDNTNDRFKQAIRSFHADQRIWREGRVEELRSRIVGSVRAAGEEAGDEAGTDISSGACRMPTPPGGRSR